MLGVVALLAAIAYLLTPLGASGPEGMPVGFRLNIRYLAPGLILALTLLAIPPFQSDREVWRLGSLQRLWRLSTLGLFAVLVVVSAGAIGAIDTDRIPGTAVIALALVAVPLGLAFLSRRGLAPVPRASRRTGPTATPCWPRGSPPPASRRCCMRTCSAWPTPSPGCPRTSGPRSS